MQLSGTQDNVADVPESTTRSRVQEGGIGGGFGPPVITDCSYLASECLFCLEGDIGVGTGDIWRASTAFDVQVPLNV